MGSYQSKDIYIFPTLDKAFEVFKRLDINLGDPPPQFILRVTTLTLQKDSTIKVSVKKDKNDSWEQGWVPTKAMWFRYVEYISTAQDMTTPDSFIRYLVHRDKPIGWLVYIQENWIFTDKDNIVMMLKSLGMAGKEIPIVLGNCVLNPWYEETIPFGKEYLGDRKWNRNSAQLVNVIPEEGEHPTWDLILEHVGEALDSTLLLNSWAKNNKIQSGKQYLYLWLAAMIRHPFEPLPYLFLFGNQETGKSILHEAFSLLFQDEDLGITRGGDALLSSGRFNAELKGKVLAVLEEVNLSQNKSVAYNRIKDWVTSRRMMIHPKGQTPYMYPNTTHWIHCANNIRFCPVFPGDTRLVFLKVTKLKEEIPKPKLLRQLKVELPQVIHHILNLEIPDSTSRLFIPVVDTFEKMEFAEQQRSIADIWWNTQTYEEAGYVVTITDAYQAFNTIIGNDIKYWPRSRFFQAIPDTFVTGRVDNGRHVAVANRSLKPKTQKFDKLFKRNGDLVTRAVAARIDKAAIMVGKLDK